VGAWIDSGDLDRNSETAYIPPLDDDRQKHRRLLPPDEQADLLKTHNHLASTNSSDADLKKHKKLLVA
jgi:hypothetical protein